MTPNPDFNDTPLLDVEYLRNDTTYDIFTMEY